MTSVKIANETVDGYVKMEVKDGASALAAVLHMTMKHCADMLLVCVDVIGEQYGIDKDEMVQVIRAHPRFHQVRMDPLLKDLGYTNPSAEPREEVASQKKRGPKKLTEMTPEEQEAHKAKIAERRAKKEAAAAAPAAAAAASHETTELLKEIDEVLGKEAEEAAAASPSSSSQPVVKKIFKIKPRPKPVVTE